MRLMTMLAGAVLALGLADGAAAATCKVRNLTVSTECAGQIDGNDSTNNSNGANVAVNDLDGNAANGLSGLFGTSTWEKAARVNRPDPADGILSLAYAGNGRSGTWSVSGNWAGVARAMLVVKGGNGFIAYLLDLTATSGTWKTAGLVNDGGKTPRISHMTLYTVAAVPLPAAGLLLLAALGGLGLMRRRRPA